MANRGTSWAVAATGVMTAGLAVAGILAATASAGGPGGHVENTADDASEAVGSGVFMNSLVGFRATGDTDAQAAAAVVAACQQSGGAECTSDEVTNDALCIVSVGDPVSHVVAGGAGPTVSAARMDAFDRAAANGTPLPQSAIDIISACP